MNGPQLFSAGYLIQVFGSLLLVFCCIVGMLYLLRRLTRPGTGGAAAPLRVLGSTSVGNRERVVLLSAGKQQILLGVAPGSVRTLHVFSEPVVSESAEQISRPDFATVLQNINPLAGRR